MCVCVACTQYLDLHRSKSHLHQCTHVISLWNIETNTRSQLQVANSCYRYYCVVGLTQKPPACFKAPQKSSLLYLQTIQLLPSLRPAYTLSCEKWLTVAPGNCLPDISCNRVYNHGQNSLLSEGFVVNVCLHPRWKEIWFSQRIGPEKKLHFNTMLQIPSITPSNHFLVRKTFLRSSHCFTNFGPRTV